MLSLHDISAYVKAAPMPLPVKEMILDQVLGHHEDLHAKARLARPTRTPMAVRVAQAAQIGAFEQNGVEENGDVRFLYCKSGEPAYVLLVRDGNPVCCGCANFRFQSARQPDYCCKHMRLFSQMEAGVTDGDLEADALIEAACLAGAAFHRAWFAWRRGTGTSEACDKAGREFDAARAAARASYVDVAGTFGEIDARERQAQEAARAQEGRAA